MPNVRSTMQLISTVAGITAAATSVARTSAMKKKIVATARTSPIAMLSRTLPTESCTRSASS